MSYVTRNYVYQAKKKDKMNERQDAFQMINNEANTHTSVEYKSELACAEKGKERKRAR